MVVSGANFSLTIILANQLGAEKFGVWAALWIGVHLAGSIHSALIVAPLQVFTHEKVRRGEHKYLGAMMAIQFGVLLAISACVLLVFFVVHLFSLFSVDLNTIVATLCLINSYLACECFRKLFFVQERSTQALVLDCIRFGTLLGAILIYFAFGAPGDDLKNIVWIAALANICGTFYGWGASRCTVCRDKAYIEHVARESWNYSRWFLPMVISQRAGPELVYAVAGGLLGIATLGGLRAMHQILGLSHLYVAVLQNVGPPALSRRLAEEGTAGLQGDLRQLLTLSVFCGLGLIILTGIDPEWLVTTLLGDEFRPYAHTLPIMAIGYSAMMISYPVTLTLLAFRNSRGQSAASLAGAGVSAMMVFPLTIWLGANGAALAFTLYWVFEAIGLALAARSSFIRAKKVEGARI